MKCLMLIKNRSNEVFNTTLPRFIASSQQHWLWTCLIPNHLIPKVSDSKPIWFRKYLIPNLFDSKPILFWIDLMPYGSVSNSDSEAYVIWT
jgi:hypothetical protein